MSLNKMMLQLPKMKSVCVNICVRVRVCAKKVMCEQYCSDRSHGAKGRTLHTWILTYKHTYTYSGGGRINDLTLSSTKERRPEGDVVGPTLLSNIG